MGTTTGTGGVRLVSADLDHIAYRTARYLLDVAILYRVFPRCRITRSIYRLLRLLLHHPGFVT